MRKIFILFLALTFIFGGLANAQTQRDLSAKLDKYSVDKSILTKDAEKIKDGAFYKMSNKTFKSEITTCPANSLFTNGYLNPDAASTSETSAGYEVATSFQSVGGTIETVHLWMVSLVYSSGWSVCSGEDPYKVNVTFYENNGGLPGTVLESFTGLTATLTPANIMLYDSYNVFVLSVDLTTPVDIQSGFISVVGQVPESGTDCWLMWVNAPSGSGVSAGLNLSTGVWTAKAAPMTICLQGTPSACPAPMNFQASNFTMNSMALSWDQLGTPTSWNIEYGATGFTPTGTPTVAGLTDNPYTVTGLNANTTYDFYIQSTCGSIWAGPLSATTLACDPSDACEYVFSMTDSWGDGWGNNYITVMQDGIPLADVKLESGASGTQNVAICTGLPIVLVWNAGSYASEVGFSLQDPFGEELTSFPAGSFSSIADGTEFYTFTSNCTPPSCPKPIGLTASGITTNSATLAWTEQGSATAWNIEYGTFGFTQGSGTTVAVTTNPYTLGELAPGGVYQFYVQADCGSGDNSTWEGPYTFTIECEVATSLDEGFEDAVPPVCWITFQNGAGTKTWQQNTDSDYAQEGTASAFATYQNSGGENQQWLVTGRITVPASHNLTFYTRDSYSYEYNSVLRVMITTDADRNNTSAYTQLLELAESDVNSSSFTKFDVNLSSYAGQDVFIAFVMVDNNGDKWYLDVVKLEPRVPVVVSLTPEADAVDVALDAEVSVTFDVNITAVDLTGITITPDLGNVVPAVNNAVLTIAHDDFAYNTTYTVLVPAGAVSDGITPTNEPVTWSFKTMLDPVACNAPTNIVISNVQETEATVAWTETGAGTGWRVKYGATGFNPDTEGLEELANAQTATITELTGNTTYEVYVQAICPGDVTSDWAGPASFTTACAAITTLPYLEEFEGAFPTECWTFVNNHADPTSNWHIENDPDTGDPALNILWSDENMMDEWAISPVFDLSGITGEIALTFDFSMSYYYQVDPTNGADVMVKVTTDNGTTWTKIWQEEDYGTFENWTWYTATLPFSTYVGESNVKFAFHYLGNDGAQVMIDNVELDYATSVNDNVTNLVSVYPNPSNGIVNVQVSETSVITIVDLAGRVVATYNANANETLSFTQAAGVYVVKVESNGQVSNHKLIIQ